MAAHVTMVTSLREPLFSDDRLAMLCQEALAEAGAKHEATFHAYCIMPHHVHLLVEAPSPASLQEFVRLFKQLVGYRIKNLTVRNGWQITHHDRILRTEESLLDVAQYIWENPVKAGLVETREAYRFSGPPETLRTSYQV